MSLDNIKDYAAFIGFSISVILLHYFVDWAIFEAVVYSALLTGFLSVGNCITNLIRDIYLYFSNVNRLSKVRKHLEGEIKNEG